VKPSSRSMRASMQSPSGGARPTEDAGDPADTAGER
jgi:hypothetical protein